MPVVDGAGRRRGGSGLYICYSRCGPSFKHTGRHLASAMPIYPEQNKDTRIAKERFLLTYYQLHRLPPQRWKL